MDSSLLYGKDKKDRASLKKSRKIKVKGGDTQTIPSETPSASPPFLGTGSPRLFIPEEYGNVTIDNFSSAKNFKPVVFPHWIHRLKFTCKICHSDIGFQMKAGADMIKMADIFQGKWCGLCHNGKIAFAPVGPKGANCQRCHSKGIEVKTNSKADDLFKGLPRYAFGNRISWTKAIESGAINPQTSFFNNEKKFVFDKDIEFPVPEGTPPDVIFPHKAHTEWLHCNSCHPRIFTMKKGTNKFTMMDIFKGKYCGICHGKVAFPFEDCFRCHSKRGSNPPPSIKRTKAK